MAGAGLSADKRIELVYQEWQYRHETFWKLYNFWGLLIVVLLASPFLIQDFFKLGRIGYFIPVSAFVLSCFGGWNLFVEMDRMKAASKRYCDLMDFQCDQIPASEIPLKDRLIQAPIGFHLCHGFLWVLSACSVSLLLYMGSISVRSNFLGSSLFYTAVALPILVTLILSWYRVLDGRNGVVSRY
jgi:hypothetical protein